MTRRSPALPRRMAHAAGIGLITAIFLLVVLAALGVVAVSVSTSQRATATMDEQGARAYQAARAGVEWGAFQVLRLSQCPTQSFALPEGSTLAGFTVTVQCRLVHDLEPADGEDPTALDRWVITATACNMPAAGSGACPNAAATSVEYVQRVIEVRI
ncbi:agglutinin biogenesis protein MshP [Massilia oculi]|uniref:Agglutinin biogenesis protein MshP n=1 Tax=Massilia hydrophila TaxID=3044279 RepID=A0ABS7Y975_9BURK|nr:agglutinin biogenesis protein MshP [Massilia oculi]MCA1856241.1 agglutinin biogenesis protein MshP [Massilia oculi]